MWSMLQQSHLSSNQPKRHHRLSRSFGWRTPRLLLLVAGQETTLLCTILPCCEIWILGHIERRDRSHQDSAKDLFSLKMFFFPWSGRDPFLKGMMNLGCCSHTVEMRSCRALAPPFRVIVRSQNDEEPPLLAWLPAVCKCGDDSEKKVLVQGVVGTRKTLCTITIHTTKRLHMLRFLSVHCDVSVCHDSLLTLIACHLCFGLPMEKKRCFKHYRMNILASLWIDRRFDLSFWKNLSNLSVYMIMIFCCCVLSDMVATCHCVGWKIILTPNTGYGGLSKSQLRRNTQIPSQQGLVFLSLPQHNMH